MNEEKPLYEERIKHLETELQKATEHLDKYKKEQEEFVLIASHDLQAPLRKLSTYIERLTVKVKDLPEEAKTYTERIHSAIKSMRTLIDGLAALSTVTESVHHIQRCDLDDILKAVLKDIHTEKNEVVTGSPLPVIEGNCIQLKHLFRNIIENAIKFQKKDSSLQIIIDANRLMEEEKQPFGLPRSKIYYKIEIKDNGIGFDDKYSEKIFQPFQRLHGKSEYEGNGLGLAICKKIIEKHRGIIYAAGSKDSGARFILILPETSE
jgi:light-regulated signal transduction histidine kinase (bacteriophytochrome)